MIDSTHSLNSLGLGGATPTQARASLKQFMQEAAGAGSAPAANPAASPFAAHLGRLSGRDFRGASGLPSGPAGAMRPLSADERRFVPGLRHAPATDGHGHHPGSATHPAHSRPLGRADFVPGSKAAAGKGHDELTHQASRWVAQTFFGTLLKQMHESPFKSHLLDGGRGGQAFGSLYDQHLADRMARGAGGKLVRALVRHIEGRQAYARSAAATASAANAATRPARPAGGGAFGQHADRPFRPSPASNGKPPSRPTGDSRSHVASGTRA